MRLPHGLDHRQRGSVGFAQDIKISRAVAVDAHHVRLVGETVGNRATSPIEHGPSDHNFHGDLSKRSTADGLEFKWMLYSNFPMRAVPAGKMMLDACSAVTISAGDNPLEDSSADPRRYSLGAACRRKARAWKVPER